MFVCLFVCVFVCLWVTDYLRNRSEDFPKLGTKLGVKNVRNVARPLFWDFFPFSWKTLICANKNTFFSIFASFWDFAETPFRGFFLNLAKMCQKIVLKDRTVVSPGKIRYFWDFGWSYIQRLTSTTKNFHFGITFEIICQNWATTPFFESFSALFFQKLHVLEFFSMWLQKKLTSDRKLTSELT